MKNLCTLLFLLAALLGRSQSFEGSIQWTMSVEITDPAMKARMEKAQQQMSDPKKQAELKEMQERMNDPEMKKMMDSNPEMKAAMENAIKSMGGGPQAGMNDMMPKGMTMKVKGGNMTTIVQGGMADGMEILHLKDQPPTRINRIEKTYSN